MPMTEGIVQTQIALTVSHSGRGSCLKCGPWRKKIKYHNFWGWPQILWTPFELQSKARYFHLSFNLEKLSICQKKADASSREQVC